MSVDMEHEIDRPMQSFQDEASYCTAAKRDALLTQARNGFSNSSSAKRTSGSRALRGSTRPDQISGRLSGPSTITSGKMPFS